MAVNEERGKRLKRGFDDIRADDQLGSSQSSSFSDISDVEIREAKKKRKSEIMETGILQKFLDDASIQTGGAELILDYKEQDKGATMDTMIVDEEEEQFNSEDDKLVFLSTTEKEPTLPSVQEVERPAPLTQIMSQQFNSPISGAGDGFKLASGGAIVIKNLDRAMKMFSDVEQVDVKELNLEEDPLKYYTKQ